MLSGHFLRPAAETDRQTADPEVTLAPFRAWSNFWENTPQHGLASDNPPDAGKSHEQRQVWQSYYNLLSHLLKDGYVYPHDLLEEDVGNEKQKLHGTGTRLRQHKELKRVEATYEGLLFKDTVFPHADETNVEMLNWVDRVMSNWSIFCSSPWQERDLGEGGQEATSCGVLEILYRAASRTFHSTSILRHLFVVHASVGEFNLASKALDSYLEIVKKAKARVEKSGEREADLDNDEIMLQTVEAGIKMYVTFGGRTKAESAWDLTLQLERWLHFHDSEPYWDIQIRGSASTVSHEPQAENIAPASRRALLAACRAIGIGQAHWARTTYEVLKRDDLQKKAIASFRKALRYVPGQEDVETLYALAVALAETRDIEGAIATVKEALSLEPTRRTETDRQATVSTKRDINWNNSKSRINEWHLLTLLLSARQDFDTAEASCEAALEESAFAQEAPQSSTREDHVNITPFMKSHVIEVKMTQMALTEVIDGSEIAVNASGELLELYTRLFQPMKSESKLPAPKSSPGLMSNGSVKGFRSSVFGRSKDAKGSLRANTAAESIRSQRHSNDMSHPPTISITNNEQTMHDQLSPPSSSHSHHLFRHASKRLQKRNSMRSMLSRTASPTRAVSAGPGSLAASAATSYWDGDRIASDSAAYRPGSSGSTTRNQVGVALSSDLQTIPASPMPRRDGFSYDPQPTTSSPQTVTQSSQKTIPSTQGTPTLPFPETHFYAPVSPILSQAEQQRHATSLLLKIWLFIAGLYRRAKLYDDAQEALDETFKQVKLVEASVASRDSSARSFEAPTWGGTKSVEELWADAYAERGDLYVARSAPHSALIEYESALSHDPDHPTATVGLSNILLATYAHPPPPQLGNPSQTPSLGRGARKAPQPLLASVPAPSSADDPSFLTGAHDSAALPSVHNPPSASAARLPPSQTQPPAVPDHLEARDRAYGLLSSLTKLGSGWDNSEAWFALARAYEESGQAERAKEVLWWVVELEEKRPVRGWDCLGRGWGL
ncbi:hypothetical protein MMC13_007352 [Lambiella insularis]|nr:hypothetical protein [Lambiella insularis]